MASRYAIVAWREAQARARSPQQSHTILLRRQRECFGRGGNFQSVVLSRPDLVLGALPTIGERIVNELQLIVGHRPEPDVQTLPHRYEVEPFGRPNHVPEAKGFIRIGVLESQLPAGRFDSLY
jgi:hypothetical protein